MSKPIRVTHYTLHWSTASKMGTIQLHNADFIDGRSIEETVEVTELAHQEFSVLVDILRHERPLFWDAAAKELLSGNEPIGEAELG